MMIGSTFKIAQSAKEKGIQNILALRGGMSHSCTNSPTTYAVLQTLLEVKNIGSQPILDSLTLWTLSATSRHPMNTGTIFASVSQVRSSS